MRPKTAQAKHAWHRGAYIRWLTIVAILVGLSLIGIRWRSLAQSGEDTWTAPVNLSRSRAASSPAIAVGPDGNPRVFWWDRFDGVMVVEGTIESWSDPASVPILVVEASELLLAGGEPPEPRPIATMPRIVPDAAGRAHAFWLGTADQKTGARPLMHSQLPEGSTSWSGTGAVTESALGFDIMSDASGLLHLVYLRRLHTELWPAGIYYRRSADGGVSWSTASPLDTSRYYRLISDGEVYLHLITDDASNLYASWDDPRLERVLLTQSSDGGVTWSEPKAIGDPDGQLQQGRLIPVPGGQALLLWQDARIRGVCGLYQATVDELLSGARRLQQRVFPELATCPEHVWFLPLSEEQVLMAAGSDSDALLVAIWDGSRWSAPRQLDIHFGDPQSGEPVRLRDWQLQLISSLSGEGDERTAWRLLLVGIDQNDEVWVTVSQVDAQELAIAPSPLERTPSVAPEDALEIAPPAPVNLSHSGAASTPAITAGSDGIVHVFWWDQFDGLMTAERATRSSFVISGTEEIRVTRESWSEPSQMPSAMVAVPRTITDDTGRIHAFWLKDVDRDTGSGTLMHSWSVASESPSQYDKRVWSSPVVVDESIGSFDVIADASGALHVAYLRTRYAPQSPAGLCYRRSGDSGGLWSAFQVLHSSRYYRLLTFETAHLRMAVDNSGGVTVTWDDPRTGRLLLARSTDSGATWGEPRTIGVPEGQPQHGRFLVVPGGETLFLWQDGQAGCALYQLPLSQLLADPGRADQQAVKGLAACPERERFVSLGGGEILMIAEQVDDALILALWNGERWSEPKELSFRFKDPESEGQIYLSDPQAVPLQAFPEGEGLAAWALILVGADQKGDIWATTNQMIALEMVFAPPPLWSAPVSFSAGETLPSLPAMIVDTEGLVHALWSEAASSGEPGEALFYARCDRPTEPTPGENEGLSRGEARWTRPAKVLESSEGAAREPALATSNDRLYAVWSGGPNGAILFSHAFAREAYAAGGWSEPVPLPTPEPFAGSGVASWPDIAVDAGGALHVVYALPLNEGRGIYYTRSDDDGEQWSPMRQVFDAETAKWVISDYPRLAIESPGVLHVVWVRAAMPGEGLPQGIYYARSRDGGETWSQPLEVAEGAYVWPRVAASGPGQVHLLWNETTEEHGWWHQWSGDGGNEWGRPQRVPGSSDVPGPVGLASDGTGTLHLTGLIHRDVGEPALRYVVWGDGHWREQETFYFELDSAEPGVAAALQSRLGWLDVVFRGKVGKEDESPHAQLWHTGRPVPALDVTPVPAFVPRLTATPPPTVAPPAVAESPTTDLGLVPPATSDAGETALPFLLGGGLVLLLIGGSFGIRLFRSGRR